MAGKRAVIKILTYGDGEYQVNDLGESKSPRFELYCNSLKKAVKKSNNPLDFDLYMEKHVWNKEGDEDV